MGPQSRSCWSEGSIHAACQRAAPRGKSDSGCGQVLTCQSIGKCSVRCKLWSVVLPKERTAPWQRYASLRPTGSGGNGGMTHLVQVCTSGWTVHVSKDCEPSGKRALLFADKRRRLPVLRHSRDYLRKETSRH